jgi:hypothetical protein
VRETCRKLQVTEFTSKVLDHWAYWNQVKLDFSRPGKPTDNAVPESFLASLRRECLTIHCFRDLEETQDRLDRWRDDYGNVRPHSSLGDVPPAHFGAGGFLTPGPERLRIRPLAWTRFGDVCRHNRARLIWRTYLPGPIRAAFLTQVEYLRL